MRTAAAYISKLKNEARGRTYKVQDTNHRLFTTTLYRGAIGCGPVDYTEIDYIEVCKCDYIGTFRNPIPQRIVTILDGGSPSNPGPLIIDGGSPLMSGAAIVDGGKP
jgi:hypothetical protein